MKAHWKLLGTFGLGIVASAAVTFAVRARAAGIPDADVLTYTGYLEDADGQPLTGTYAIDVTFYGSVNGNDDVCDGQLDDVALVSGRFQVPLPDCVDAVRANPNIWVDVQVDSASLGRTQLGAVPYAIEAGHASAADEAGSAVGPLEDRIAALETALPTGSAFRAYKTTAQSIPGVLTQVLFDTETYDLGGEYNPTTGVFTSKEGGYYDIGCNVMWSIGVAGTSGAWEANLYVDSARVVVDAGRSDGQYATRRASTTTKLEAGSTVACYAAQDSGPAQPLHVNATFTYFEAIRIAR